MWVHLDVCRLVANNLGSFAINVGYTPSIVAVNLGNFDPMFAGRDTDVCKPLHLWTEKSLQKAENTIRYDICFEGFEVHIERLKGVGLPKSEEMVWVIHVST